MNQLSRSFRTAGHLSAAARVVVVLTVLVGLVYPLAMTAVAQLPSLRPQAQGWPLTGPDGHRVASALIGQAFTDADGNPLPAYFQTRPSNAGTGSGYDPTASGASNLGPESVVDTLPDPTAKAGTPAATGTQSLLTQVCARSKRVGDLEQVDGRRPYCTSDGVGAVLGVFRAGGTVGAVTRVVSLDQACPAQPFLASWSGVPVECAKPGKDYASAIVTPVRGEAAADPGVPPDAVTAGASGLDPQISPAYARLQAPRIARERGIAETAVAQLIARFTTGRALGVLGEPAVNVVELNLALDRAYPRSGGRA
jgi:potassium-transporting ATPase KdpC subunit